MTPRWLSLSDAAEYCSLCSKTLLKYILEGEVYASKKGGKWIVDRESLDAWLLGDETVIKDVLASFQ